MSGYSRTSTLGAYQSVAAHGGVAAADPHRLIVMLMDGALERIAQARGCIAARRRRRQECAAELCRRDHRRAALQPRPESRRHASRRTSTTCTTTCAASW